MTDFALIETLTQDYATARERLAAHCRSLQAALESAQQRHREALQRCIDDCANAHTALEAAIAAAPELFMRPRSVVMHGIKVGWQKNPGKITFEDAGRVAVLIHRHFPDRAGELLKPVETPIKQALAKLSAQELKRIGCNIENASDTVLIKPADGWVEKFVDALLKDALAEAGGE